MAIAVDQNYDKAQRKISTNNLAQFAGVNCQLLVEKETHRPIIMDGSTLGGKFKCASTDEVKAVETVANNAISQAYADEHYLGITAKAESAKIADNATNATNANTAIKASQDANGNAIPETYATKSELTSGLATKQPVGDYPTKSELDSTYLGINAKAKSAETADTAITADKADSVAWSAISDVPTGFGTVNYGSAINLSVNGASASKAGVVKFRVKGGSQGSVYVNNVYLGYIGSDVSSIEAILMFPVSKGDTVKGTPGYGESSSNLSLTLYPFKDL